MKTPESPIVSSLVIAAVVGVACLLAATLSEATAQDVRTLKPKLEPKILELQKGFAERLQKEAERHSEKGSPEYYAILRHGFENYRGPSTQSTAGSAGSVVVSDLDKDEKYQQILRQMLDGGLSFTEMYGGADVEVGWGFDSVVALENSSGAFKCTGTMISPKVVLTAAHCVCDGKLNGGKVRFGLTANRNAPSASIVGFEVFSAQFCSTLTSTFTPWPGEDIAVTFISPPTGASTPTSRFAIAKDRLVSADKLNVVGFGLDENGQSGKKKFATLPIFDAFCSDPKYQTKYGCSRPAEALLWDMFSERWVCLGDSGGPAMDVSDDVVIAVSSRVVERGNDRCLPPSIHALITKDIADWLSVKIAN